MDNGNYIHNEDPFKAEEGRREPGRRFRGRLVAPVTIWTSGSEGELAGLTVASTLVAEGDPSSVLGLINDLTDLYDRIVETERFVVHVAQRDHRILADRFAGLWPSPGGLFGGLDLEQSDWGPVVNDIPTRAFCRLIDAQDVGYQRLLRGRIERIDLHDIQDPLAHFRGGYRGLAD